MNSKIQKALDLLGDIDFEVFFGIVKKQSLPEGIESIDYEKINNIKFQIETSICNEFDASPSKEAVIERVAESLLTKKDSIQSAKNGGYFFNIELLGRLWVYSDIIKYYIKSEKKYLSDEHYLTRTFQSMVDTFEKKYEVDFPIQNALFQLLEEEAKLLKSNSERIEFYYKWKLFYEKESFSIDALKNGTDKDYKLVLPIIEHAIRQLEFDYTEEAIKVVNKTNKYIIDVVSGSIKKFENDLIALDSPQKKIEYVRAKIKTLRQQQATPITPERMDLIDQRFLKDASSQLIDWLGIELEYLLSGDKVKINSDISKSFSVNILKQNIPILEELYSLLVNSKKTSLESFNILLTGSPSGLIEIKNKIHWVESNKAVAYLFDKLQEKGSSENYASILESVQTYNMNGKLLKSGDIRSAKNQTLNQSRPIICDKIDKILSRLK